VISHYVDADPRFSRVGVKHNSEFCLSRTRRHAASRKTPLAEPKRSSASVAASTRRMTSLTTNMPPQTVKQREPVA
jgi:hypothetical protein